MKLIAKVKALSKLKNRVLGAPLSGYPGIALNQTKVLENLRNSEIQAGTLVTMQQTFGFDIIFPFMDLSVEAEALGLKIAFHDNSPPEVQSHPIHAPSDLQHLILQEPSQAGRMPVFAETIQRVKSAYTRIVEHPLVAGYVSSPFTLAGLLMGAENLAINTLLEPEFCTLTIDFTTEYIIRYATYLQKAGADFLVLLDPTAVLLSPELYNTFVRPSVERVSSSVQIPVVLHVCGNTTRLMVQLASTKVDGLSLDSEVSMPHIMNLIPDDMLVMGNINPVSVFFEGTADMVATQTKNLMESMAQWQNFVISSGCDLPIDTPLANIEAFAKTIGTIT